MTVTTSTPAGGGEAAVPPEDLVKVTIDGIAVRVRKNTLVIRAAETNGRRIPRFCDHLLLDPAGACRQCVVDVVGRRKPFVSCPTTDSEGMVVRTQLTSPVADKAAPDQLTRPPVPSHLRVLLTMSGAMAGFLGLPHLAHPCEARPQSCVRQAMPVCRRRQLLDKGVVPLNSTDGGAARTLGAGPGRVASTSAGEQS